MERVPYAFAVGSLMYSMVCTHLDITYVVGTISRFFSNLGNEHWNAAKWIMGYLQGTSNMSLCFGCEKPKLIGCTNANMARDIDSHISTSSYLIIFAGGVVAWHSRLQKCVTLSTTEAGFLTTTKACKELLWMKKFI